MPEETVVALPPESVVSFHDQYYFLNPLSLSEIRLKLKGEYITFPTLEHAFQACKSTDIDEIKHIAGIEDVIEAMRYGRRELKHERTDFSTVRVDVMKVLLDKKFRNPWHRRELMKTGTMPLTNTNKYNETYWGVNEQGTGRNWLGKLLMDLRASFSVDDGWLYHDA
jgi:predicted NAD-dependent protein-ADP-ribosyltransferase YbiA (DUF1768 family)